MKKRLLPLFLCLVLLLGMLLASQAGADSVCFISVNEQLLDAYTNPYFSGGVTYVPYTVFTDYSIKMYYSYLSDSSTVMLYTAERQLFFDMSKDKAYGDDDKTYDAKAIVRGGVVYLPASFVCSYFGNMSCTYIVGYGYGDIVRIKDINHSLPDDNFLMAASDLLRERYKTYTASQVTPTPSRQPETSPEPGSVDGAAAYLNFRGLPGEMLLSALRSYSVSACFFLSAEDVRNAPDLVRRLDGEGHTLGVYCGEDTIHDYETTAALLYEAARIKTLLITTDADHSETARDLADAFSLVYVNYSSVSDELIDDSDGSISLLLESSEHNYGTLSQLLRRMRERSFDIRAPRETDLLPSA